MPQIRSIYRYPIKGLSPEPLARAKLAPRQTVPGDRLYAIENGPSGFDPAPLPICQDAIPHADAQRAAGALHAFTSTPHSTTTPPR